MYAVEFQTTITNGTIQIPEAYRPQLSKVIRVIILSEPPVPTENMIAQLLANPRHVPNFSPLTREEIYER